MSDVQPTPDDRAAAEAFYAARFLQRGLLADDEATIALLAEAFAARAGEERGAMRLLLDSCRAEIRCLYRQATGNDACAATGSVRKVLARINDVLEPKE
jgi:hypothetical protein